MPSPRRQTTEEYDLSSIQPPVKLGVNGAEQIARCLAGGSEEIKHLLRQECRIIFECCVCSSLFRSLANFLAHKRVYCKEDHLMPNSDLASHVSILRQYIQTKAAAMATLAEGTNTTQSKPMGGNNADMPPNEFVVINHNDPMEAESGSKTDQNKHNLTNHLDTPKKKKPRSSHSGDSPVDSTTSTSSTKKKKACDSDPSSAKKSVKRKLMGGIPAEGMNGELNIADTFVNHKDVLLGEDANAKKTKSPKTKPCAVSLKTMECSVVMEEKDMVAPVPAMQSASSPACDTPAKPGPKTTKGTRKDLTPHLLYPCLYCDNVFPGTRMAIDHITAVHKKRKAVNVSKIRTKIRKKAFVVKSGKKMRRFQKVKPKSLEKEKVNTNSSSEEKDMTDEVPTSPEEDSKVGKRGHVSHKCANCGKVYLYKMALERHQLTCTTKQKLDALCNEPAEASRSSHRAASPNGAKRSNSLSSPGSTLCTRSTPNLKLVPATPVSKGSLPLRRAASLSPNCRIVGEIVLSSCDKIKTEPQSPVCGPSVSGEISNGDVNTTPHGSNGKKPATPGSSKETTPIVIPIKSEYPCPYCMIKPKKTFDLLFTHISDKHKDLRPSRKRVVRFLMNSGYKCSWCKSPPRFFKNRVLLRRHREKEHGMTYTTPSLVKSNGNAKS